jgi:hypothetical protein
MAALYRCQLYPSHADPERAILQSPAIPRPIFQNYLKFVRSI